MRLNGKAVTLPRLKAELAAAGIVVPALGIDGDDLHTYGEGGVIADLPAGAAAVLAAHVADDESPPTFGADAEPLDVVAARQVVANHRAFLANATPTNAEVVQQVRRLTRVQLAMLRRQLGGGA